MKPTLNGLWFVLLLANLTLAQEPKPPTDEEIREAKVYEAIADMISRRDELLDGKFAVLMHGECVGLGYPEGPTVKPQLRGRVVDARRSFDLKFLYTIDQGKHESGFELVRIGTKYKARRGFSLFVGEYEEKPPNEKMSQWLQNYVLAAGFDPFDDYLTGANAFEVGISYRQIESIVLKQYKLLRTERGLGDILISHWSFNPYKGFNARIRMEFDPAVEMNLIRHSIDNLDNKNEFQETRISWIRHGKRLVPNRIELATGSSGESGVTGECTFKCRWLFDDEVPDTIFTENDHLAALTDHFQIPHTQMVNGERIEFMHVLPEDLYEDETK